jgi:hypothetical protein
MEKMREEMESQFEDYRKEAEARIQNLLSHSNLPIRKDEQLLPAPKFVIRDPEI